MPARFALFLLAAALAGCDALRDPAPDTFEVTLTGERAETITGGFGYTRLSRYTGIGTGDSYGIALRTAPMDPSASPFYEWTVPDSVAKVHLFFDLAEVPSGTYTIEGQPWAGGSLWVGGRWYVAHAGRVTVGREGDRLVGSFRFDDLQWLAEEPAGGVADLRAEGRFDIGRDE